jgi:CRP/FNR family transcriptional regulator, cyclic AMP receptor protein
VCASLRRGPRGRDAAAEQTAQRAAAADPPGRCAAQATSSRPLIVLSTPGRSLERAVARTIAGVDDESASGGHSPRAKSTVGARERVPAARLLAEDPDLGEGLPDGRRAAAIREVRAQTLIVRPGEWMQPDWPVSVRRGIGLLVLDGLLVRRVGLDGRFGAELVAAGDVLRPWQREDAVASMPRRSGWRVLRLSRIAILDLDFIRRAYPYPEVVGALSDRTLRRSRSLAVIMAIIHQPKVETRLHMLLWHLADRWGRVSASGVMLPVKVTHAILADLVAAQRPTVSAALGTLERGGAITRTGEGWLLHGSPPSELSVFGLGDGDRNV